MLISGSGKCVLLEPKELDRDIESLCGSSAHAQKSLIKSPGRLKATGAVFCICEERDERLGSQPKCLPIAAATPEVGAFSTTISHGILWSDDDTARDRTEYSR
jgi:hypothetical protein